MAKSAEMGKNRTGIEMSPIHSKRMISGAKEYGKAASDGGLSIAALERQYIIEADPIGSVPMPGKLRGALKTGAKKAAGKNPEVLLNKLGERLAFERAGVRLYESVINKCDAVAERLAGPVTVDELQHIRDEELEHFRLLSDVMESLGADPTAETPDADVSGVAAMGFQHVLNDPRTTMPQCLEMLLTLELADNACWELLIRLADEMGLSDVSEQFQRALEQEKEHVLTVRSWYEEMTLAAASKSAEARH
ncbi:MAG TPA: ferritin-like domain-containing protein [Woeseiaceae bacterium]|nr:ferritin-like domain-containing protein [Woeseiaceae bacterium]